MNKILFFFSVLVAVSYGQSIFLRELAVPRGSINQFGDWIQQIERSEYLDCPTNENRFGLTCDPAAVSRDDLDNYFCGSQPNEYGWCGAYWAAMHAAPGSDEDLNSVPGSNKRGVSNGALPINTNVGGNAYERYQMYLEMFGRVCSCHCGCSSGCTGLGNSEADQLFCGAPSGPVGPAVLSPPIPFAPLDGLALVRNSVVEVDFQFFLEDEIFLRETTPEGLGAETDLSNEELSKRRLVAYPHLEAGELLELEPGKTERVTYGEGVLLTFHSCEEFNPENGGEVKEAKRLKEFVDDLVLATLTVEGQRIYFNELKNGEEDICSDSNTAFAVIRRNLLEGDQVVLKTEKSS